MTQDRYTPVRERHIGRNANLVPVLKLGQQALVGVFPKYPVEPTTAAPLRLGWCPNFGLLQLTGSYDLDEIYGENDGYRSGVCGAFMPDMNIFIVPAADPRTMQVKSLLVLPSHFKRGIVGRRPEFLTNAGRMIFRFPEMVRGRL